MTGKAGNFRGRCLGTPGMQVLASLNNESQSLARRARTAFWRLIYAALILYKGILRNAPERPTDALKRKPYFQVQLGRENPLCKLAFIGAAMALQGVSRYTVDGWNQLQKKSALKRQ